MPKISDLMASGMGGILPMMMAKDHKKQQAEEAAAAQKVAAENQAAQLAQMAQASQVAQARQAAQAGQESSAGGAGDGVQPMKKGGVTRADGCISKGHTKGKMVAMSGR
jgi:hypothetical protein